MIAFSGYSRQLSIMLSIKKRKHVAIAQCRQVKRRVGMTTGLSMLCPLVVKRQSQNSAIRQFSVCHKPLLNGMRRNRSAICQCPLVAGHMAFWDLSAVANWRKATKRFNEHERSTLHRDAIQKLADMF
ncbi:uncharacterized protein V6R79_018093 [Siganus canaliculatus]